MVERRHLGNLGNLGNLLLWNEPVMCRVLMVSVLDLLSPTQEVQHVEAIKRLNKSLIPWKAK